MKEFSDHVYLLDKALYELKQAPPAWYEVVLDFLIMSKFTKCVMDPILSFRKKGKHIMQVELYVDDIIFGSTKPNFWKKIEQQIIQWFEMSMMGEMSFFLIFQVNQSKGIS